MWKWLRKFTLEIAPPVTATVLGAFVVHQLWPSGDLTPKPVATPPAAQAPAESLKPASLPGAETSTTAAAPMVAPSPDPVTAKAGKPSRQSNEVAKTAPREEPAVQRVEFGGKYIGPGREGACFDTARQIRRTVFASSCCSASAGGDHARSAADPGHAASASHGAASGHDGCRGPNRAAPNGSAARDRRASTSWTDCCAAAITAAIAESAGSDQEPQSAAGLAQRSRESG